MHKKCELKAKHHFHSEGLRNAFRSIGINPPPLGRSNMSGRLKRDFPALATNFLNIGSLQKLGSYKSRTDLKA